MSSSGAGGAFDPQCVPICVSTPGHGCVSEKGFALGTTLAVLTFFAVMPQVYKIWKMRTSAGFSLMSMMFMIAFGVCNLAGTLVVKWRVLSACGSGALGPYDCFTQLLDAQQQVASVVASLVLIVTMMALPPHSSSSRRRGAVLLAILLLFGFVIGCVSVSYAAPCSPNARGMAKFAAICATGFVLTAQLPQVAETWRMRGRGSLSYIYYGVNSIGCLLINVNQIVVLGDPWPVWLPTFFSGVFQLIVLLLGGWFLNCAPGIPETYPGSGLGSGLLPRGSGLLTNGQITPPLLPTPNQAETYRASGRNSA